MIVGRRTEVLTAFGFIFFSVFGYALFVAIPAVRNVVISFTNWNLLSPPKGVGFRNYRVLFHDPVFWHGLKITVLYVIYQIPIQTVLALFLAVMMSRFAKSIVIRGTVILPYLLPPIVGGLMGLWMLNPLIGIVNVILGYFGIGAQPFLGSVHQALASIAGINIWQFAGFNALLFFAGLQTIPSTLYEAAGLDGASEWQMFWRITLPLLRPVTAFVVITSVIGSFQVFATIAATTQGGPVNATRVLTWYMYEQAFEQNSMGYGAAISTMLTVLLVAVSLVQFLMFRTGKSELA